MNEYQGPRYLALQATADKGRTYRWHVFPMPWGRSGSVRQFRGPFAGQRAKRHAAKLSRRSR